MNNKIHLSTLSATISAVCFLHTSLPALAQVNAEHAVLTEILVTAQKREESLSDVPISVAVIGAERLNTNNINKVADLTEIVPNLTMTETGISTQMYIRGIGSGNNQGFEQSVGQYIDGIYYGRQQLIRAPFFDLERIEVLRGPQGTLFGKNSIAGALSLTTAKPSDEFEASVNALYEFESEQKELTAIISGPLSDTLRARLAYRGYQEEGYIENTFTNKKEPQRDEDALRLTLDWDISSALNATLKIEHDTFKTQGRLIEIVQDDPNLYPAGSSPIAGFKFSQILEVFGQPDMDSSFNYERQANVPESSDSTLDNITLNVNYELAGNTLTFVTGLLEYDFIELCDCDYTPSSIFEVQLEEDYQQFSQEIRLSSPGGENVDWIIGAYYQDSDMNSKEGFKIPQDSFINILATLPGNASLAALPGTTALRQNSQSATAWAVFAQSTWNLSDKVRMTLGGRYTQEDKDATRRLDILDTSTASITTSPFSPLVYYAAFDLYSDQLPNLSGGLLPGHDLKSSRSENSFTPLLNIQWDIFDNTMFYASATTGFKAGGFDARANNPFSFEFEEEESTSFEIGTKSSLADGSVELNMALFFTDYDNLQISQYDGNLGFNVGNANKTEMIGLEIDGRWAASENLTVGYAYSHLDFEFTDFSNGNCYNRQVPDGDIINGIPLCDYTGSRGIYTPENNLSLFFDYFRHLGNGIDFVSNLNINFVDSQNVHDNLDPNFIIDSYTKVNLRVGIQTDTWSAALLAKNLTDEGVLTYAGNVPITANIFGTNTFYGFAERPRQIALEASYRF